MRLHPRTSLRSLLAPLMSLLCAMPAHAERVAPQDEPAFVQTYKQLAIKMVRGNQEGAQFIGSGFAWVHEGRAFAVTNFHVAEHGLGAEPAPSGLYVAFPAPVHWRAATHLRGVPEADIAVVETSVEAPQANPYTLGVAGIGEAVYSIGYDEKAYIQDAPVVFKGRVLGVAGALFPRSVLVTKPPFPPDAVGVYVIDGSDCEHGASGSMLLNSRGELVAVNAGRIQGGLCVAVDIDEVVRLLRRR
jgi:S1-C subfamily serine protease